MEGEVNIVQSKTVSLQPDHNLPQASQGPMAQWTYIHVYLFTIFFLYICIYVYILYEVFVHTNEDLNSGL